MLVRHKPILLPFCEIRSSSPTASQRTASFYLRSVTVTYLSCLSRKSHRQRPPLFRGQPSPFNELLPSILGLQDQVNHLTDSATATVLRGYIRDPRSYLRGSIGRRRREASPTEHGKIVQIVTDVCRRLIGQTVPLQEHLVDFELVHGPLVDLRDAQLLCAVGYRPRHTSRQDRSQQPRLLGHAKTETVPDEEGLALHPFGVIEDPSVGEHAIDVHNKQTDRLRLFLESAVDRHRHPSHYSLSRFITSTKSRWRYEWSARRLSGRLPRCSSSSKLLLLRRPKICRLAAKAA